MIELSRSGAHADFDLEALRQEFSSSNTLRLPGLLAPAVLARAMNEVLRGSWTERRHPGVSLEHALDSPLLLHLLHFLACDPAFLQAIREITGFNQIQGFAGRVFRMLPGSEHEMAWHDDIVEEEGRLVGMSVNLSSRPYEGGTFELRDVSTPSVVHEFPNLGPGDALLFRISPTLNHRVTQVRGTTPRTSFAGWFHCVVHDDLLSRLRPGNA